MAKRASTPLLIRIAAYMLPGVLIVFGALIWWDTWRFTGSALPAEGEVLSVRYDHATRTDISGRTVDDGDYYPTVRYQDREGDWWQAETTEPVMFVPEVGQTFQILYHVEHRGWIQQAHDATTLWLVPAALIGIGLLGLVGVTVAFRSMGRADAARTGRK